MNVVLCDDDPIFLESLKQRLSAYECDIYTFNTVRELIASGMSFDIAFLDIELENNTTGFQAVKILRMRNKKCVIAFFTNYNQYAIKGYDYQAFRYILKREPDIMIDSRINDVFTECIRRNKIISGSYNGYTFSTPIDDIYYISISNHVITLHTEKGRFELYKQMKDVNKDLCDAGFIRCHRSYMVNMHHVFVMRHDYVFVLDDMQHTAIPIGVKYRKTAESSYLKAVTVGGE